MFCGQSLDDTQVYSELIFIQSYRPKMRTQEHKLIQNENEINPPQGHSRLITTWLLWTSKWTQPFQAKLASSGYEKKESTDIILLYFQWLYKI